jgi:pimeloyl-ACP methyl ester carboxylesterase
MPVGRRKFLKAAGAGTIATLVPSAIAAAAQVKEHKKAMSNIVLVPGAFHGGWYYSPLLPALRAAGHNPFTISLSGLNGPKERQNGAINLDTHIDDVVSLIEQEQLNDVVLCGHSYGGMVIAGAAERLAGRIKTLLFIDALVPENGDSVWTTFKEFQRDRFIAASPDGLVTPPPPGVDSRARPHPLATFLQPVRLTEKAYAVKNKVYALCANDKGSPFEAIHSRLVGNSAWQTRSMACGHDFMNEAPELAQKLILEVAKL